MSKGGPASLIYRGIMQYRQSYLMAKHAAAMNDNPNKIGRFYFNAAVDVLGMTALMPKEVRTKKGFQAPTFDDKMKAIAVERDNLTFGDVKVIKEWILDNEPPVEQAASDYVYDFFKRGRMSSL